jgi:hypothetical protein
MSPAMTVAKASTADRVVAVFRDTPVAAWRIRFAFASRETYQTTGGDRPRVALSLGPPLPVLPAYHQVPALRHGCALVELDVEALAPERDESTPDRW